MKKGFTLVELLLFMGLSAIFLVVTTELMQAAIDFRLETYGGSATDLSGQMIYKRMMYDLRRASLISDPAAAGQTSTSLTVNIAGNDYTYSVSGGRLQLTTAGNTEAISDQAVEVTNFLVQRFGSASQPTSVEIILDLESLDRTTGNISQTRNWQFSHVVR